MLSGLTVIFPLLAEILSALIIEMSSSSGSLSFAKTSIVTGVLEVVVAESSPALGGLLEGVAAVTEIVTVAESVPPLPSLTV